MRRPIYSVQAQDYGQVDEAVHFQTEEDQMVAELDHRLTIGSTTEHLKCTVVHPAKLYPGNPSVPRHKRRGTWVEKRCP